MMTFVLPCLGLGASQETTLRRWQPHEFVFRSERRYENPFEVPLSADVKSPDGRQFTVLGFYDGLARWKIRLSADTIGPWTLRTRSRDPDLDGKAITFHCVGNDRPNLHGPLRVDKEHPHHFIYEDGTRHFLMGYECDWLWALDMGDPALPRVNAFLDNLAAHGFNHVILNAYAHDTSWRTGKTDEHDYGPPPMYAWEGSNDAPDHSRFNLKYWQHYDRIIHALYEHGITAHILIKVYNKMVKWPARGSAGDDLYFRWLIARYAAYPNVVWDFSKEAQNEKDLDYKRGRMSLIRNLDPFRRLLTNHDDDAAYDSGAYDDLLDFRSDQQHSRWHEMVLRQRKQHAWPVVNVEFGYEHGPGGLKDKTYGVAQSPEEVCRRAWEICMAGGYVVYYYTYTAWDVIRPDHTPPGYAYFKRLREFFEETRYWLMSPADQLVSDGYCLANPGKEYIVFLARAKPFTLRVEGAGGSLRVQWRRPFTGVCADAGAIGNGLNSMTPPPDWDDGPIVLRAWVSLTP